MRKEENQLRHLEENLLHYKKGHTFMLYSYNKINMNVDF